MQWSIHKQAKFIRIYLKDKRVKYVKSKFWFAVFNLMDQQVYYHLLWQILVAVYSALAKWG